MVEDLLIKQSKLTNFDWKLSFSEVTSWENITNKIKIHCYRTLQETLHNIHKYAKATEVEIKFFDDEKVLLVEIIDNGIGFHPSAKTNGIGLQNIQSRIAKLKGKVEIISAPGYGTKIRIKIPLN
jgi:signal transduction histidine kinase